MMVNYLMYDSIRSACDVFVQKHPELSDPDAAVGQCFAMSEAFCLDYTQLHGVLVDVGCDSHNYPRRHQRHHKYFALYHTICLFPDKTMLDLTYRQLDHQGPIYNISTVEEIEKIWTIFSVLDPCVRVV